MFRSTVLAILTITAATTGALARPASLEGKWRLNPAETESLPGEEQPAELVMAITKDDDQSFRWTVSVKMANGEVGSTGFVGAIDGKPYPVAGRPGNTSTFSWMPDGSLKQVSQGAGGISVETCGFSADMKKMTCNARQTDMAGRAVAYVEVFDRL
jgi:hypothetical protein